MKLHPGDIIRFRKDSKENFDFWPAKKLGDSLLMVRRLSGGCVTVSRLGDDEEIYCGQTFFAALRFVRDPFMSKAAKALCSK